jgi:hypothetical protein
LGTTKRLASLLLSTLFDASNNLVGSYSLAGNGNTSVDQFLGLESSAPFVRAEFTNNLTFLSVVLDNLEFSATPPSVPEPDTLALLGLGVFGVAAVRQQRTDNQRVSQSAVGNTSSSIDRTLLRHPCVAAS